MLDLAKAKTSMKWASSVNSNSKRIMLELVAAE